MSSGIDKIKQAQKLLAEAKADQSCEMCHDELEDIENATEAAYLKISNLTNMVNQMESKGVLDAEDKLKAKYGKKEMAPEPEFKFAPPITRFNQLTGGDDLGVSDLAADFAGITDDVRETRTLIQIIRGIPSEVAAEAPNPFQPFIDLGDSIEKTTIAISTKQITMPRPPKIPRD